jgi:hypothetical protein
MPLPPLPIPDVRLLDRTPSWPAWASLRLASIKIVEQRSLKDGRYKNIPTLPRNLLLSHLERAECDRYAVAVRSLLDQTPNNASAWRNETLAAITWLMLNRASRQQSELGVVAIGEAYLIALGDTPWWAVKAAADRWCRGACGTSASGRPHEYEWRPDSAILRVLATDDAWKLRKPLLEIERLLAAEPLVEFDEQHCATMQRKFSDLAAELRKLG